MDPSFTFSATVRAMRGRPSSIVSAIIKYQSVSRRVKPLIASAPVERNVTDHN